ncbi:MAG: type I-E CRISPR-associated protein Cse1/CasA [Candidatus Latescibacteria bacterium]|nr:type I-E CRISPR-associated protein Cse1/CasA [Candidatus Latescibacterota bacterium]
MNLIGDPWIPVVFQGGQTRTVGLNDLYEQAEKIRDLALAPPQRIAVMRLLICITQTALNGPEDKDEWISCKSQIAPESLKYLAERKERFDLFGEIPFMQIKDLEAKSDGKLDKLDFGLASGNNKTLFDQSSVPEGRSHPAGWASLQLLTFLNFSTGGQVGDRTFSYSAEASPAVKAAHLFIRGENLCETIWLNLLTKKDVDTMSNGIWGRPIWDMFPHTLNDTACLENATQTYLGRLVPLSRLIRLDREDQQVSASCIIAHPPTTLLFQGPPSYREPSTTVIAKEKGKTDYLYLSVDKHVWRDLGSVLALNLDTGGGAMTLRNLRWVGKDNNKNHDIWVGGLIPSRAAVEDAVEWNFSLPLDLLGEPELKSYQTNVDLAESSAISLSSAVRTYLDEVNAYKGNDSRAKDTRKGIVKRATSIYWQELDQRYGMLFEDILVDDDWRHIIGTALRKAYEQSCVHETPRQIQAFVAGQKRLGLHKLMAKGGENGESG